MQDWQRQLQAQGFAYVPGQGMVTMDPRHWSPVVDGENGPVSASEYYGWPPQQQQPAAPVPQPAPAPAPAPQTPAPAQQQTPQQVNVMDWINGRREGSAYQPQSGSNRQSAFANWQGGQGASGIWDSIQQRMGSMQRPMQGGQNWGDFLSQFTGMR